MQKKIIQIFLYFCERAFISKEVKNGHTDYWGKQGIRVLAHA
ncbi:hypothetical protein J2Z66_007627 [Paenibacillus eucommiae]|uniref:Uncharacterized protein n=1 Tax=Paenibacillus eucommiae TaxID=1355755 RepID=A0ABS4J832_9BACL|nr:hypothetical protein [Paenibacillus eucommiae]